MRDYIHIMDLAKAHVVAVKRMLNKEQKNNYEFFNIGTGEGLSVLQIVKAFERVNNLKLNYKIVARRAGDIEKIYADTTFANQELGWKAEETLDEMMRSAWKWQQETDGVARCTEGVAASLQKNRTMKSQDVNTVNKVLYGKLPDVKRGFLFHAPEQKQRGTFRH